METRLPLIACSLSAAGQRERLNDWKALLASAESREQLSTGIRYQLPPALAERIRTLAVAEHECCSFLRFDVAEITDAVVLTVETDEAAQDALRFIFR